VWFLQGFESYLSGSCFATCVGGAARAQLACCGVSVNTKVSRVKTAGEHLSLKKGIQSLRQYEHRGSASSLCGEPGKSLQLLNRKQMDIG
jgi:hypothetical protein